MFIHEYLSHTYFYIKLSISIARGNNLQLCNSNIVSLHLVYGYQKILEKI